MCKTTALRYLYLLRKAVTGRALLAAMAIATLGITPALAQTQFFTQSGGRGLQNAKTNARLTKAETDITGLAAELAKVKPHAKEDILQCADTGNKLRWDGSNWTCDTETDPTVQGFAKKALPTCASGQLLSVVGGDFGCTASSYVSDEVDPTVQPFAKAALPSCGTGEVLTSDSSGNLKCAADGQGLTAETDPMVHDFARTDKASVANCAAGSVLTMTGSRLTCVADSTGVEIEEDPFVQTFARNDLVGYNLTACATGEVLRSTLSGGDVILACQPAATALDEALALGDLSDVDTTGQVSGSILRFNGSSWLPDSENDPTVRGFAKHASSLVSACVAGEVVTYNGTYLDCTLDAGGSGDPLELNDLSDVSVAAAADGSFLKKVAGTWTAGSVSQFAQDTLPTCAAGEVLKGDGTSLSCVADAGGAADPISLDGLSDVVITAVQDNQILRYEAAGTRWINVANPLGAMTSGRWCHYDGTNVVCDRPAPSDCADDEILSWDAVGSVWACTNVSTAVGNNLDLDDLGDVDVTGASAGQTLILNGSGDWVDGDPYRLLAGNSQVLVTDAGTGVIQLAPDGTAALTATTSKVGIATNTPEYTLDVNGDLRVTGQLYVSGSQVFDGVTFANGGVSATGTISATRFVGDGSGLTGVAAASGAAGAVQFSADGSGSLGADVSNFYWDNTGKRMGIRTANPNAELEVNGTVSATNLRLSGNLYVSGSQTIDGVTFANGGIQATGAITGDSLSATTVNGHYASFTTITAGTLFGDGTGLTGVTASNMNWYGLTNIPVGVQNISTTALDVAELTQLQNIGTSVLPAGVWSNLAYLNQSVSTTAAPTFAGLTLNGDLSMSGRDITADDLSADYIAANTVSSTVVSATNVSATTGEFAGDLMVRGNLSVSGTQVFGGVTFANGGVQATGTVTATTFAGSGAGLTDIPATAIDAAGVAGSVQFKGATGDISGTSDVVWSDSAKNLKVAGTMQVAGTGAETCGVGNYGQIRFVDIGGGVYRMQMCRP